MLVRSSLLARNLSLHMWDSSYLLLPLVVIALSMAFERDRKRSVKVVIAPVHDHLTLVKTHGYRGR